MVYSSKLRSIAASGLLVGGATASIADCSAPSGGTLTVGEVEALRLSACPTFTGSIAIASDVWDSISLDGIEEITGSLSVEGAETLTYFSSNTLTSVGSLELSDSTLLTGFDLPSLSSVDKVSLSSLPLLWEVDFGSALEQSSEIEVRNTYLTSLDLDLAEPKSVVIEENDFLWSVSVSSSSVDTISIGANGNAIDVSFPYLESAKEISIGKASALSLPALTSVESSLVITDSYLIDETFDLSSLESIGGDLEITGCSELSELSLSSLKSIGGDLKITDNSFSSLSFESLETISGSVHLEGEISDVSWDSLSTVGGTFDISGATGFSCDSWDSSSTVVDGKTSCSTTDDHEEPESEETPIAIRSTPVASIPTDIASTPSLSLPVLTASVPPVPSTPAPAAITTPKPAGGSVTTPRTPIVTQTTYANGSVALTTFVPAPTTPGVVGGTPAATPDIPVSPFDGAAAGMAGPVAGLVGLVSAAVAFCLL